MHAAALALLTLACHVDPNPDGDPDDTVIDTPVDTGTPPCAVNIPPPSADASVQRWPFRVEDLPDTEDVAACVLAHDLDGDGEVELLLGAANGLLLRRANGALSTIPLAFSPQLALALRPGLVLLLHTSGVWRLDDLDPSTLQLIGPPVPFGQPFSAALFDLDGAPPLDLVIGLGGHADVCVEPTVTDDPPDALLPYVELAPGGVQCLLATEAGYQDAPCPAPLAGWVGPYPFGLLPVDLDDDASPELLLSADFALDVLLARDGDGWTDRAGAGLRSPHHAHGAAWSDLDRDGLIDLFVSDYGPDQLLRQGPCGHFSDQATTRGISAATARTIGWAPAVLDVDGDGDPDLFVTGDMEPDALGASVCELLADGEPAPGPLLLVNDGAGRFTRLDGPAPSFDAAKMLITTTTADLDGDGDLDVLTTEATRGARIWWNDAAPRSWVQVQPLEADGGVAWGARVIVDEPDGSTVVDLHLSTGLIGEGEGVARVAADSPVDVRVRWPDGAWTTERVSPGPVVPITR